MNPYYSEVLATLYNGDARAMVELPDGSVQCVVTSPPYWGLRKYAGDQELIWDGDNHCEHQWGDKKVTRRGHPGTKSTLVGTQTAELSKAVDTLGSSCVLCGAYKCGYGLEPTPEMYVEHTIQILREVKRVLRKDGVVFWNIGDSYATSSPGTNEMEPVTWEENGKAKKRAMTRIGRVEGLKPKDLCLIPFRIAIAAQEDGWWVRSIIIWSKSNPMPESVTDRPTESHEYILMLTKSKSYYWDQEAVREKANPDTQRSKSVNAQLKGAVPNDRRTNYEKDRHTVTARNIRSVWSFPTRPYPGAHFAVFPDKLPETCIKAATPEVGCCSKCGAPWERVIDINRPDDYDPSVVDGKTREGWGGKEFSGNRPLTKIFSDSLGTTRETLGWRPTCKCDVVTEQMKRAGCDSSGNYQGRDQKDYEGASAQSPSETKKRILKSMREPKTTIGWQGTCGCDASRVPSLVLDLFAGAGTTLAVGKRLGRRVAGYELSEQYCKLTVKRLMAITPPLPGLFMELA